LGAVAVVVQVGIQIKEVGDLVKSWDSTHPSASTIEKLITDVGADITRYQKLQKDVSELVSGGDLW
jgi:hypothetical protein